MEKFYELLRQYNLKLEDFWPDDSNGKEYSNLELNKKYDKLLLENFGKEINGKSKEETLALISHLVQIINERRELTSEEKDYLYLIYKNAVSESTQGQEDG